VNRLIEYPITPPIKTSEAKWADKLIREKATAVATPYAAIGTQR
jgi:hypothetical protein